MARSSNLDTQQIFSDIYRRRAWGGDESVSGPGSTLLRTAAFRNELARLLKEIETRSLLDAGCGDFNWMKQVELEIERYVGVDVVPEIISHNNKTFANPTRSFLLLNIINDVPPKTDVIFCRDCLVHFSFEDILATLKNFQASGSKYLLTTTFIHRANNTDIKTGEWRPLNLQAHPFNLTEPVTLIDERCAHTDGAYADKRLALWEISKSAPQESREISV